LFIFFQTSKTEKKLNNNKNYFNLIPRFKPALIPVGSPL